MSQKSEKDGVIAYSDFTIVQNFFKENPQVTSDIDGDVSLPCVRRAKQSEARRGSDRITSDLSYVFT